MYLMLFITKQKVFQESNYNDILSEMGLFTVLN